LRALKGCGNIGRQFLQGSLSLLKLFYPHCLRGIFSNIKSVK
jgi:hypothetical protein